MLNRRGFFARLAAAGAAILGIKAVTPVAAPDPELERLKYGLVRGTGWWNTGMDDDTITSIRHLRTWSEEYQCYVSRMDVIYGWGREEALKDLHFYSGDQWGVPGKYGRLTAAQRRGNPARLPA